MGIRGRLTFWFGSLFGVIVLALAVTAYLVERSQGYAKLDAALRVATEATAMAAQHELGEHSEQAAGERDLQDVLDGATSQDLQGTQILVRENGRNVAYKPAGQAQDLRGLAAGTLAGNTTRDGLRIASYRLPISKFHTAYMIYAGTPAQPALAQVERVRAWLTCLLPIGLVLAGSVGHMLAGRALTPLREFAQTLDGTDALDLGSRVKVHNPRDAIGKLALRFNALMDRLEQSFKLQRRFMADASHQIRTPVTIALVAAQVTARDSRATVTEMRSCLQMVERQMLQLRRIVDDMFFLSQSDVAPLKIERKEMYLDDAIAEAARAVNALAKEKRQTIQWSGFREARCLGDADLLAQAVLILLDNAVKFTPDGGAIGVALGKRGECWVCSVSDDGMGIPERDRERIFERFYQVDGQPAGPRKGAGLGLAIAKSIVEGHGGSLKLAESRPGATRFEIAIPALEPSASRKAVHANSSAVRI